MIDFDALVEKNDPDRRMAALFAPAEIRARLMTLYAFYHEIAKIPDSVSEPVIGEMRLAWARDAIEDLFASPAKVRRHDIYEGLSELREAPGGPDKDSLITLIEARSADLGEGPFPTHQDRLDYIDRTAGILLRLSARLCAPQVNFSGEALMALAAGARIWGLVGLLRAFPSLAAAGRAPYTREEMLGAELSEVEVHKGLSPEKADLALKGLWRDLEDAQSLWARTRKSLPAEVFPAIGYIALTKGYARQIARADTPYSLDPERPLLKRQARLIWASLTGRI
ncbi:squalene/phytoene synthase family protein [Woodsholea maritima]|uniref:squalene/phytoene synthase family protein n=1 Tax=Woodsholea maritima TaxID=240237 RepID=UPI00037B9065|nr:squalene/phytoene synthase family protein [Woodsholea maritima]